MCTVFAAELVAGYPGSLDAGKVAGRRRKARTVFSDQQLHGLEKRFGKQRYLSTPERVELATALNLSETQVRTLLHCKVNTFARAKTKFGRHPRCSD